MPPHLPPSRQTAKMDPVHHVVAKDGDVEIVLFENTYIVSSRDLKRSSAYFKAMFEGPWKDSRKLNAAGRIQVEEGESWNPALFLNLLQIFHGSTSELPRYMTPDTFARMAQMVDFYDCAESVEFFADQWLFHGMALFHPPKMVDEALINWLCVSSVFKFRGLHRSVTRIAQAKLTSSLPTMSLPIPDSVISRFTKYTLSYHSL